MIPSLYEHHHQTHAMLDVSKALAYFNQTTPDTLRAGHGSDG